MTYRNVLAAMKETPEDKRMLLGGAWTPEILLEDGGGLEQQVSCGCALAEFVPGIVEDVKQQAKTMDRSVNSHFSSLFRWYERKDFNGMNFAEAADLECRNDRCLSGKNRVEDCKSRFASVEKFVGNEVQKETESIIKNVDSLTEVFHKEYLQTSE
jgi:hypothetical protein